MEFKHNNDTISNGEEIAENFHTVFSNIGKTLASKIQHSNQSFEDYLSKQSDLNVRPTCAMALTTASEICQIVGSFKDGFSCGLDNIPMHIVKNVIMAIADPLSHICNLAITSGLFPDNMKLAKVCPVYKSDNKMEFSNYRPISILPTFSKILEKIIYSRLINFINKHNILSSSQYGFRKNHSTYMAILALHDKISEAIDKNECCIGIFIDLSKAFDTINHEILLKKLEFYGVRGLSNTLLKSYLTNRKQYVSYANFNSSLMRCASGFNSWTVAFFTIHK